MKRNYCYGIWDDSRGGFWLREDSNFRLAFPTQANALQAISTLAKRGFPKLKAKRFEANSEEIAAFRNS